jgi:SAM-dependent methyltransferase
MHRDDQASEWVRRWSSHIARGGHALDLACGFGRHTRWLVSLGHSVTAVDRDAEAIATLAHLPGVRTFQTDLENGTWPFSGQRFDAVIVTNYLHRPIFPAIIDAVAIGGVLIYETFAIGNERFGRPSNPAFLLKAGELLEVVRGSLKVLGFEDIEVDQPKPAMVQRICARRGLACSGVIPQSGSLP